MIRTAAGTMAVVAMLVGGGARTQEVTGRLTDPGLTEISGLAVSARTPELLWGINDGGHAATLYAFDRSGRSLGRVRVANTRNHDWEDLAAFTLDGGAYLVIADTGDNRASRALSWLHVVAEPVPAGRGTPIQVEALARIPFRFEDGPRDCEAVAVDTAGDRIILISKRNRPAAIYDLPLTLAADISRPLVARRLGTVAGLPAPLKTWRPDRPLSRWQHQPTALDIAPDGRTIALLTYRNVYLYDRAGGAGWRDVLAGTPRVRRLPGLAQFESLAFDDDELLVVAEGAGAEIIAIGARGDRQGGGL